ncbi:hypothetical protein FBU31_000006 [Coemansia sp. 'formosensis']|nr:hypothetical protein FBU31_000006 [Coemansia sp. 'formosensis']
MQFFLDDTSVPIRLFSASNAPHHHPQQPPSAAPRQQQQQQPTRSVPGCPYIRFVDDDDYDGSYPFDAFQDLRVAYGSSPLASLQSRMRHLQQQRAQAQLQRLLLEQQMREHVQRERELRRYQLALEQQRQAHSRAAAEQARRTYLDRLAKEERERQVRARGSGDVFSPPFHFFNRILENQLKSQDDVERRRAQKVALAGMLDAYFGQEKEAEKQAKETPVERTPSASPPPSTAGAQQPLKAPELALEPSVLDNVLRVVHDRLNEIAAEEAAEQEGKASPAPPTPPRRQATPSAEDAAGAVPEQKGVEIEEPIDYSKLANILRGRVNTLNDVNVFVPPSPPMEQLAAFAVSPPPSKKEAKAEKASPAMELDSGAGAEHTDSEFAGMMSDCKAQLKDLKEAASTSQRPSGAPTKRRQRRHRPRHRAHHHDEKQHLDESLFFPPEVVAADMAAAPEQDQATTAQKQKQAVNTIEDYILGVRSARKAQAAMASLRQLHAIELELDAIREQYNRQLHDTQLSFVADKSGNLKLAYNQDNKPFLMYQDVLQRLLCKLDEVPSGGDEIVRAKRKAVVVKIQNTLDALDQFAADQESEATESGSALADESSNAE